MSLLGCTTFFLSYNRIMCLRECPFQLLLQYYLLLPFSFFGQRTLLDAADKTCLPSSLKGIYEMLRKVHRIAFRKKKDVYKNCP